MNEKEFDIFFREKCFENNINILPKDIKKFYLYMNSLMEWNNKINLTAIKDEKGIIIKHFIDSIIIGKELVGKNIIDIGSGAGFPGIPLKLIDNDLNLTLIDSVNKKVNFMNYIIDMLGLTNTFSIHIRAEGLAHNFKYREAYDVAVSRAVANMSTLVEYMIPFVKIGGKAICLKGPNSKEEIDISKGAIEKLGGEIEKILEYKIDENERCLVIIKKIKSTEQIYPRKQGKPLKEPLR